MNNIKKITAAGIAALISTPLISSAQAFDGVKTYLTSIHDIVNMLIIISVAAAVLVFFWGLVRFIARADNEKEHESGRNLMIWGSIALFIIASVGGIIFFIQSNLGIYAKPIDTPSFTGSGGGNGAGDTCNPCG
jgi:Na+/proline symporter